ncbi:Asp/Glu racemase [Roseibium polysiphoniae]|uniref:Asp/Glu racemase n=1 Tax=Roseibium polysiphoniae TaxID=2571221 RepID=A0A944GUV4_9HYPH|nr:aspartate/glutamate racemase family protein [Roseibium polysiphoniae]MBS8262041.1 Asp/Glu racemase [Roseibium polysiphoniae]
MTFRELQSRHLPFEADAGNASRAAIGLIVLQSDETLEVEFRSLSGLEGVAFYHSRIPSAHDVTPQTLQSMHEELPRAAGLLPDAQPMDVVAYCCTSGTAVIGPDNVAAAVQSKHPSAKVTNPMSAVLAACAHLGVKRPALVSPYTRSVSRTLQDNLEAAGLEIAALGSFEQEEEAVVARICQASLQQAICEIGASDDVDAVFASCTNLRSFDVIEACEAALNKPVITSNQALAWHILQCAGLPTKNVGPGRLFNG